MVKKLSLVALLLVSAGFAQAQDYYSNDRDYGIHYGYDANLPVHRDPRYHNEGKEYRFQNNHHSYSHGYNEDGNHAAASVRPRQDRPHLQNRYNQDRRYIPRD